MSKEDNGSQDVGATAFDYTNSMHPNYSNRIYYGNQYVPMPTNSNAKITYKSKVMRQTMEGK